MFQQCKNCQQEIISPRSDQELRQRIAVPEPTLCSFCRQQRRLNWRNERNLYQRKCDLCGQDIIAIYPPEAEFPVYCLDCWWGDNWDQLKTGQDYDFNKSFTEQFAQLLTKAPRAGVYQLDNYNCPFINHAAHNKNCHLIFSGIYNEDCYYGKRLVKNNSCLDCLDTLKCELCYECINCDNCYHSTYSLFSSNLIDCNYCYYCRGCTNCFGCVNLINQKYHIFNKPYQEEEYHRIVGELKNNPGVIREKLDQLKLQSPHRANYLIKCLNCSGDFIKNSKNTHHSFYVEEMEDCGFAGDASMMKDCLDDDYDDESELIYDSISIQEGYDIKFSAICYVTRFANYSFGCMNCENLFGCVGLHSQKYCILNKKYDQEEYNKLVPQIINQMRKSGEWGEFFPVHLSPFAYNQSLAQEFYPLIKEEALAQGYRWRDKDPQDYQPQIYQIPKKIFEVPDSITKEILACVDCGKNYKITPQELDFYRQLELPIPKKCFDCRHLNRLNQRNPRRLWQRQCMRQGCDTKFETTYAPQRPEIIYCPTCYQQEVY